MPAGGLAVLVLVSAAFLLARGGSAGPAKSPVSLTLAAFSGPEGDGPAADVAAGLGERVVESLAWVPGVELLPGRPAVRLPGGSDGPGTGPLRLEGSVESLAGSYVVTARLAEAGAVDPAWTARYVAEPGDPEVVRREVAFALAEKLRDRLVPFEPKEYTDDDEAYDRYLEGVWAQRNSTPQDLWKAIQHYREALERDSTFALAHAITAEAYIGLNRAHMDPERLYGLARESAERALALDSTLAEGHAVLATIDLLFDRDYEAAGEGYRRAVMLHPGLPQGLYGYGQYLLHVAGRPAAGIEYHRRTVEAAPLSVIYSHALERALFYARDYEGVVEQHRVTRALSPDLDFHHSGSPLADALRELGRYDEAETEYRRHQERSGQSRHAGLAILYARTGRPDEARAVARELERIRPGGWPVSHATIHAALGEAGRAMARLEEAWAEREWAVIRLGVDPAFDPLRADPRFQDLLRQVGLRESAALRATTGREIGTTVTNPLPSHMTEGEEGGRPGDRSGGDARRDERVAHRGP